LWGASILAGPALLPFGHTPSFPYADIRFKPHYPTPSPLADVLRLVPPGSDEYVTEKYAFEIEALLNGWGSSLKASIRDNSEILKFLPAVIKASSLTPAREIALRSGFGIDAKTRQFGPASSRDREHFLDDLHTWLGPVSKLETVEFEIYRISERGSSPLTVELHLRYDLVAVRKDSRREERVGSWQMEWSRDESNAWKVHRWEASEEIQSIGGSTGFLDVTMQALGGNESYQQQMLRSIDYWRTTLDGASGIDVYANNGVAAGDYDNDGFDDFYVCQPAGLPNRLYRNRGRRRTR
jgi:hypothetical protein